MTNRYTDSTTSYVYGRLANATPEQIDSFIIEACELDSASYLRNTVSILGSLKFKTIVESNVDILKLCLKQKVYKAFETIFIETDLDKGIIASLFLNSSPPLEIALLLNHIEFRDKFLKHVDRNQVEDLREMVNSLGFTNYPHQHSLLDKALMRMFTSYSEDISVLDYFLHEENLKHHNELILKQGLNLAVFTHKYEVLKYMIIDLNIERTKYVDILLELDKDKVATNLFNSRDLSASLRQKLSEKTSENKEEIIKI